jgi:hypothetical protein
MRFTVQAPDGRRITLEGDKAPTEQELNNIFGYSGNQPEMPKLDAEALEQIKANNAAYKSGDKKTPRTTGGKVADFMVENPVGRGVGFAVQGSANSMLNPFGYAMRAAGVDTNPLGEPQTAGERSAYNVGQYGTDAALALEMLLANTPTATAAPTVKSAVYNTLTKGGLPAALTTSTGSALATGIANPENEYLRMATDTIGAGGAYGFGKALGNVGGAAKNSFRSMLNKSTAENTDKQLQKAISRLQNTVNSESLNNAIAEAERTGRSVLEVGDDAVLQAAQEARQQTPQARKVLTDYLNDALSEQTQRTRSVIDENLGTQGKYATVNDIMDAAKREAQPIYNELEALGDLAPQNKGYTGKKISKEDAENILRSELRKIPTEADLEAYNNAEYLSDNIKAADNISISGRVMDSTNVGYVAPYPKPNNNISRLGALVKDNDVVADAINKVKHSYSSLKNLPDTDAKVLLEARKLLSKQTISNDPTLAYQAKSALSEFDPVFDDITGGKLTKANQIYKDAHKFQEAADLGRDVFNNRQSVAEFRQKMQALTRNEKKAVKIGLRDEMVNRLGAASNENVANKKFLVENTRQKLKAVVGEKQGDKIIDEAEQAVKLYKNANQVLSGSQTAEKTGLRNKLTGLRRLVRNPWDTITDYVAAPFDNRANVRTAEALTNKNLPSAYKQMQLRQAIQQMYTPTTWTPYMFAAEEIIRNQ